MHARHLACALFVTTACATPPTPATVASPSEDPCVGRAFDFDAPDPVCLVPNDGLSSPPEDALAIRTVATPAVMRSGEDAEFILELRNVSGRSLPIELDDSRLAFQAIAVSDAAASFESECGGLCARSPTKLKVTLESEGTITKGVHVSGTMTTITGDACEEQDLGALPPGDYRLEVDLPWTDLSVFSGPLIVRPATPAD